ncbi:acetylglutamate kinase [Ascidiimonas aurantiaca]|uniref:acetylglutamate kinase n=1 Tax=Ascidiimonas aurantiaca TaxID=1685432 RepID=UPI0030EB507A
MNDKKIKIVKIGGNIISDTSRLQKFLEDFAEIREKKVLVHGGGKLATEVSQKMGITPSMLNGRRITDAETLNVVTMVYGGLINKTLIALLQKAGCNALGFTGADANIIKARKRQDTSADYGYAGDIEYVNNNTLSFLIEAGITPVVCSITHNEKGQLLNTNADTIAAELAIALGCNYESALYYCFEKAGVLSNLSDEKSVIHSIDTLHYKSLVQNGHITDGMLPKLQNCFYALQRGVQEVYIGNEKLICGTHAGGTTLTL